jgi:hypothetical protein
MQNYSFNGSAQARPMGLAAIRSRLLSGTALALCAAAVASPATASDWSSTFWGGPFPFATSITVVDATVGGTTTVNVNNTVAAAITTNNAYVGNSVFNVTAGGTVNSLAYGIWGVSASTQTATINGAVNAAGNGVALNTQLGTVGDITVSGVGTVTGTAGYGLWLLGDKGAITVTGLNGGITAGSNAVYAASTTGNQTYNIAGPIKSTAGYGIAASSTTGNIVADGKGTGSITAGLDGVYLNTVSTTPGKGLITVQNFTGGIKGGNNGVTANFGTGATLGAVLVTNNGDITGTVRNGVETYSFGTTTITNNGNITGAINGIAANFAWASPGDVIIAGNKNITGGAAGSGIVAGSGTGNVNISAGAITSGGTGIWAVSSGGGNVIVDGAGTGTLTGTTVDGALVQTLGNATVSNFATVTGARNGIYVLGTGVGTTTSIQGNGPVTGTALNGIVVGPSGGDVNIGTVKTNGVINGGVHGIWVNNSGGAGATAITVDKSVTGTAGDGILSTTLSGNQTINVLAPSVVQGGLYGLATATTTGTATTNNAGTIQNIGDAVGAPGTAGLQAVWLGSGTNVVNNNAGGQIIGGFTTGGIAATLNNNAGSVWAPSLANSFGAINDTVNNAGTINIRAGSTIFAGLENFNNQSGGLVNMAYNSAATDNLTVLNMSPKAGSAYTFNFDANGANNSALGFDNSSNGKGTADTIVVTGAVTPAGAATVNLVVAGKPASLTGSVALIYTGVNLVAPTAGATIVSSTNYIFGAGKPAGGATAYFLVDDGKGGVYLQWAPNASAASLAGFSGVIGGAGTPATSGSSIAAASAGSTGVGGVGFGGGPTGGGVIGRIGDMAASSVSVSDSGVQVGNGERTTYCQQKRYVQAWAQVEGEKSTFSGGRAGQSESISGGVEVDAGQQAGLGCNRLGFGFFGFAGGSRAAWETGSSNSETNGVGAYVRATSAAGFYATALGAVNWNEAKLANAVIGSTAEKSSHGVTAAGSVGYLAKLGASMALDTRGFASYSRDRNNGFTDSVGITVTETRDNVLTYGASIGLHQNFNPSLQGFVRVGIKKSDLDSAITAYGNTMTGSAGGIAGSLEAGVTGNLGNGLNVGASGFTTFSEGSRGYGGRAQLGVKF